MNTEVAANMQPVPESEPNPQDDDHHRRAEIRASLEASRVAFHELIASLEDSDLHVGRPGSWTVGEAAIHMINSMEQTPALIRALQHERNRLNLPLRVGEPVKRIYTWWAARGVNREHLERRFDAAQPKVVAMMDTVHRDEWTKGALAYGEGYWTVESAFRHQRQHVEEHVRQIRHLLEGS